MKSRWYRTGRTEEGKEKKKKKKKKKCVYRKGEGIENREDREMEDRE